MNEQEQLWEARRRRALRWAASDLRGYPALAAAQETEQTLAAEPPASEKKKGKEAAEPS